MTLATQAQPLAEFATLLLRERPYQLVRHLGGGAMGEVFEIEHQATGRRLVLKSLRQRIGANAAWADRLRLEAQTAGRLRHPNLVSAVDFWITPEGFPCFVMELLRGASLADDLRRARRLPVLTATKYAIQVLSALAAAHDLGIVHRDIKPENLFVCRLTGRASWIKVLDFGIARVLPDASTGAPAPLAMPTATGTMVGTPRYMSPEALEGRPVDLRADLYSVGVVLYVMLAGTGPFDRVHPGQSLDAPPPPSRFTPEGLPDDLDRIVLRAMRERPEDRYQTATEFASELKDLRATLKRASSEQTE